MLSLEHCRHICDPLCTCIREEEFFGGSIPILRLRRSLNPNLLLKFVL